MKKTVLCSIIFIAIAFTFCKKKEETPAPAPTTSTTGGTTTGSPDGSYSNLQTGYNVMNYNNVTTTDSSVFASFYVSPPTTSAPVYTTAGNVNLNTVSLTPQFNSSYSTNNPCPINISGVLTWSVAGAGTITAFTYSYAPSYPKYSGFNLLPDTCIKANGINITINGVTNYNASGFSTGLSVHLIQNTLVSKFLFGSSGTLNFSAAELSGFTINNPITIMVSLNNLTSVTIGGFKRDFSCLYTYQKISYLK